jgi:Cd2+/Zn2+-exporting ATPase
MVECEEPHAGKFCAACRLQYEQFEASTSFWKDRRIAIVFSSAFLFALGILLPYFMKLGVLSEYILLIAAVLPGVSIVREGISSLVFEKTLSIDFLMTIAAIGSFLIGHGEEGVAVVLLFYIAEFVEAHATDRARRSIGDLVKLAPDIAVVKRGKREVEVHAHNVAVGEVVVVRPGKRIPLDGRIINGASSVNQAPITGESVPVPRQVGDEVYAGTINCEGFLEIEVTKPPGGTMLSKIVELVENAQNQKSPAERFIDRFSRYYTPIVILLAFLVATIPTYVFGLSMSEWVYKALVLLVVSCPCALALSTPVTMISGITSAARNGVLIKGGTYLEEINNVKVFAFDKTGTLTEGKFEVTDIVPFGHHSLATTPNEIMITASSLEAMSEHPIAKAIVRKAEAEGVQPLPVQDFRAIAGKGAVGQIDSKLYYVGSEKMFEELSIAYPQRTVDKLQNEGKTVVLVGDRKKAIGLVAVTDKIRDAAVETIAELKKDGIKTEMITGDNKIAARAIAKEIGVDEYFANLLPEEKADMISRLAKKYTGVAMVGDGVNDAPALARADVGIAMGAVGSDASIQTADVALMQDDLSKLPYLVRLSRKALGIVRKNTWASILIKGAFAILTFPGYITLWLAVGVGDMGLSLAVILNAMRLYSLDSSDDRTSKLVNDPKAMTSE